MPSPDGDGSSAFQPYRQFHDLPTRVEGCEQVPTVIGWVNHFRPVPSGPVWLSIGRTTSGYQFRFPDLATFDLDPEGLDITVYPAEGTPERTLTHLYKTQVWPMLLAHRGTTVLHASAVEVDGAAVAFLGETGWGKSTLAASMAGAGHPLVSDDVLPLHEDTDGRLAVTPTPDEHRLWGDSAEQVLPADRPRRKAAHYSDKMSLEASTRSDREALPLRRLYLLEAPDAADGPVAVEAPPAREAVGFLLRQSFRLDTTDHARLAAELDRLADLTRRVPIRRLRYPRDYDRLPDVRAAILDDLEGTPGAE